MLDVTAPGDNTTLVIVFAMVAGFLRLGHGRRLALLLLAASADGPDRLFLTAKRNQLPFPHRRVPAMLDGSRAGSL